MMKNARILGPRHHFLLTAVFSLAVGGAVLLFGQTVVAQESPDPLTEERMPLAASELEELVGRIALYPDDLVSIVLPASTYPLQIVQAARYLKEHENNPAMEPDESWDDSVVALLNYPEVIELMNADLDWTWKLGEAVLYQQAELMSAIQEFRGRAYVAGNLDSDDRQVVTKHEETIVIEPADPKTIYVPYYEPSDVVVYHSYPVYHYYPRAYPVYYYPYRYGHSFGFGFFWGVMLAFSIDWHSHHLHAHHHHHHAHPYHRHNYHRRWYRHHSVSASYSKSIWRPGYKSGSRQHHTASVLRQNQALGASSAYKGKYRKRNDQKLNDQRLRTSARKSAKRSTEPATATHRRKQSALSTRPVSKLQKRRKNTPGMVTKSRRNLGGSKKTPLRTSTAATKRVQPNPKRTRPARLSAGVRSTQSSGHRSGSGAVSRQKDRSSFTSPRGASTRQGISRHASPGTQTFKGVVTRSTPSPARLGRRAGAQASTRSGFSSNRYRPRSSSRVARNRF